MGKFSHALNYQVNLDYFPKYVGSVNGQVFNENPVAKMNFFIGHDSGFYADVFASEEISEQENKPLEIDGGLGWDGKVFGLDFDAASYVVAYDQVPAPIIWNEVIAKKKFDHFELFAGYDGFNLLPYAENGWEAEQVWNAGIGMSRKPFDQLVTEASATMVYDCQGLGSGYGFLAKASTSAAWKLNEYASLVPRLDYFLPLTTTDERKTHFLISVGIVFSK